MPNLNVTDHFRLTFAESFREVVQQSKSRLREAVNTVTGCTGVGKQIDFVLPLQDEETTGQRYKKVTLRDLETNARWYYPRSFDIPSGESRWDEKSLAPTVMPNGKHVIAHAAAFNRRCDSIIMEALVGFAYTGKTGADSTALPFSQTVPVNYMPPGTAAGANFLDTGLTVSKLIEAIRILKANEAWNVDERANGTKLYSIIDSATEAFLKNEANKAAGDRLFSRDFDTTPSYDANGTLVNFLGINFINYEKIPTLALAGGVTNTGISTTIDGSVTAGTGKKVAVFTSTALEFGVWNDIQTSVDIRPDLSNAVQFLSQYSLGAGREQEEKVVQIIVK
jgi:hypothetical protein